MQRPFLSIILLHIFLLTGMASIQAQNAKVTVTLSGHEGKPLAASHALMFRNTFDAEITVPLSAAGRNIVEFSLTEPGVYKLFLSGVNHQVVAVPVLVEEMAPIEIHVRLGTHPKNLSHPDSVFLMGNINQYSLEKDMIKMKLRKDGSYIAYMPAIKDSLLYKPVLYSQGDPVQVDATEAKQYIFDTHRRTLWGGGHFYGYKKGKEKNKILFRPQQLLTTDLPPVITYTTGQNVRPARIMATYADINRRIGKVRLAWYNFIETKQLGSSEDFYKVYDISEDVSHLLRQAEAEADPVVKDLLYVSSSLLAFDTTRAQQVLTSVSPESPVWQIAHEFYWFRNFLDILPDGKVSALFAEQIANATKEPHIRAGYLQFALETYYKLRDDTNSSRLYQYMLKEFEGYPGFIRSLQERLPSKRKIIKGEQMPDFSLPSLDQPDQMISSTALQGKIYLIDLWATWCTPCVAEMKNLHHAFKTYKDKGFTIVSISLDENAEKVAAFRRKNWNMPWLHSFVSLSDWGKMQAIFEQQAIPRAILVDANGTIIAIDEELKGAKLEFLLQKLLK